MRSGVFCKYKACGATTKHMSGYCHTHNKQWMAGYRYALKQLQGCESPETCTRGEMLVGIDSEMSGDSWTDDRTLPLQFDGGREGEGIEGIRRKNSVGVLLMPPVVRPGDGDCRKEEKSLGCGISDTN